MPYNSTVRLHQLNLPELSGYILQFFNVGTGASSSGLFSLIGSGRTYVSSSGNAIIIGSNDSGLATSGDLNNLYYSIYTGNNNRFYSINNPSGFVTLNQLQTGQFNISNLQWFNNTGFKVLNLTSSSFDLDGPTSKIQFYQNAQNPSTLPYVSGFDAWINSLVVNSINGSPVISSGYVNSGYVPQSQFTSSTTGFNYLYLKDSIKILDSKFFQGQDFYFKGQESINVSNPYVIDLYGSLATGYGYTSGHPFILGFDVYAGKITSSGSQVLTFADTGYYVTPAQLLSTSGYLMDAILRYRSSGSSGSADLTNVVFTTGNQSITGIKTFNSNTQISGRLGIGINPTRKLDVYTSTDDIRLLTQYGKITLATNISIPAFESTPTKTYIQNLTETNVWGNLVTVGTDGGPNMVFDSNYYTIGVTGDATFWGNTQFWGTLQVGTVGQGGNSSSFQGDTFRVYDNANGNAAIDFKSDNYFRVYGWSSEVLMDIFVTRLNDHSSQGALDWDGRYLIDNGNATSLDWQKRTLSGNWNIGNFSYSTIKTSGIFTVNSGIGVIFVDTTISGATGTMPNASGFLGAEYTIKDWKGNSASKNIVITGLSGQKFDGQSSISISTNYGSYTLVSDGANWSII